MRSQSQRRYLWANDPEVAREFESKTKKGARLPEKVEHGLGSNSHEYRPFRGRGSTSKVEGGSYSMAYEPEGCSYESEERGHSLHPDDPDVDAITEKGRLDAGAGYDLTGLSVPPQGRETRRVLATHDGIEQRGSDYAQKFSGFRYRSRHDGV